MKVEGNIKIISKIRVLYLNFYLKNITENGEISQLQSLEEEQSIFDVSIINFIAFAIAIIKIMSDDNYSEILLPIENNYSGEYVEIHANEFKVQLYTYDEYNDRYIDKKEVIFDNKIQYKDVEYDSELNIAKVTNYSPQTGAIQITYPTSSDSFENDDMKWLFESQNQDKAKLQKKRTDNRH